MNITDVQAVPLHVVFATVATQAATLGVGVLESELVGLIPRCVWEQIHEFDLRWRDDPGKAVLEDRIGI